MHILDCSIFGTFIHKSAETNINVFKQNQIKYNVGGAGNVALNLLSAGQNVKFISVLGNDNNGKILSNLLKESGALRERVSYFLNEVRDKVVCLWKSGKHCWIPVLKNMGKN